MVLIEVFGPVSGAHFNPAVTFAFALRGDIEPGRAVTYVAVQAVGAIIGVLAAHAMFDEALLQISLKVRSGPAQWFSEIVATFGLLAAIFGTLRFRPAAVPQAVGLYITAAYWFTASTSFANPAVTLARSLTNSFSGIAPAGVAPFIIAQLLGAAVAAGFFVWLLKPFDDRA